MNEKDHGEWKMDGVGAPAIGLAQGQMGGLNKQESFRSRLERNVLDFQNKANEIRMLLVILDREPELERILEKVSPYGY